MAQTTKTKRESIHTKMALVENKFATAKHTEFTPGDTIKVFVKIKEGDKERLQAYEGVVMGFSNTANRKTFTVRKISHGVGVERVFPMHSPSVAKIEVVSTGKVRRAKLGYLRSLSGKAARVKSDSDNATTNA